MSGSNVGAKGLCAVIDTDGTVLPCLAIDNGDGTSTLKIDASVTVDSIDIGDVDIKEFPSGNLGQQLKSASLSVAPATDITDATYIGDIKFGESAPLDVSYSTGATDAKTIRVKLATEDLTALENVTIDSSALPTGAATEANQALIKAAVEAVTAKLSSDQATATLQGTGNASLASIDAKGFRRATKEFIRADNATQYSELDCLAAGTPSTTTQNIPLAARVVGGSGTIVRAVMKTDMLTWTNPISVMIYDLAPPAAFIADNDAFDVKYVDSDNIVAVLEFPEFKKDATGAAGSFVKSVLQNLNIPYRCAAASQDLTFQCFLPSGTPTPANLQKFKLNIGLVRD